MIFRLVRYWQCPLCEHFLVIKSPHCREGFVGKQFCDLGCQVYDLILPTELDPNIINEVLTSKSFGWHPYALLTSGSATL